MSTKTKKERKPPTVNLADFSAHAKPLQVHIGGTLVGVLMPGPMSTGSFGWKLQGPCLLAGDDVFGEGNKQVADCQLGINCTVKRSGPPKSKEDDAE
jgi:hypothetical protein